MGRHAHPKTNWGARQPRGLQIFSYRPASHMNLSLKHTVHGCPRGFSLDSLGRWLPPFYGWGSWAEEV